MMSQRLGAWWQGCLCLLKKLVLLPRSIRLQHCEFEIGNPPRPAAYIGEGISLPYYLKLYGAAIRRTRTVPIWGLRRVTSQAAAGFPLVLVEVNQMLGFLLPDGGWTTYPWVRQETDLESARYQRRRRGIERGYGQAVRRHGLRYRLSRDRGDLERFYREYYLPYLRQRHGDAASVRSLGELNRALRSGFLLQVWQQAEWVSGLVVSRIGRERVQLLAVGLDPSHFEKRQQGAVAATYYFLFLWARENGQRVVDFCGSRPHLLDGVYRHKLLWAAEPTRDPWHHAEIVLYLDPTLPLPEAVSQQLVRRGEGFAPLAQVLHDGEPTSAPRT